MGFKERREAWTNFLEKKLPRLDLSTLSVSAPISPEAAAMPLPPLPDGETIRLSLIPESEWEEQVEQLATMFRWKKFHTHDARRSEEGFPDLILLRPPRLVVAELKKMGEDPEPEQLEWLDLFKAGGAETFVWRPSDFDDVMRVLR